MDILSSIINSLRVVDNKMKPNGRTCLQKSLYTHKCLQGSNPSESFQLKIGNLYFHCFDGTDVRYSSRTLT